MLGGGDVLRVRDRHRSRSRCCIHIRDGLNGVIFVKNTTGTFSSGNDFGDNVEIEFIGDASDSNP